MLSEISPVRQVEGEPPRRWFSSDFFDLILWYEHDGTPLGFQLCYDLGRFERALTWRSQDHFTHLGVDSGEGRSLRHKGSAMLVPDGSFDAAEIGARFRRENAAVPAEISALVLDKITAYAARG